MTFDVLQEQVPAAMATKASDKVSQGLTKKGLPKYTFIPTYELVEDLKRLNWELIDGRQQKSKDHSDVAKHMLRFRHPDFTPKKVGDTIPEILIVNAHDRSSSFRFYLGLYRLVCSNGMVVQSNSLTDVRVPHRLYTFDYVREQVQLITENAPKALERIERFKQVELDPAARLLLAQYSLAARFAEYQVLGKDGVWKSNVDIPRIQKEVDMNLFLTPQRPEDNGNDLWSTFNLIQEKIMKGGFYRESEGAKLLAEKRTERGSSIAKPTRLVRPLSNIGKTIQVNQDMWQFAEKFAR